MHLALFDLDNTLLPLDSDHAWASFLGRLGVIDGTAHELKNNEFYAQYQAGTLNIEEFLAFQLKPLAQNSREQLDRWHQQYMAECITPHIHDAARTLIRQHQQNGDLTAIVTATNEFVTRPIATAFNIEHLLAIELEQQAGAYTGRHTGTPSFREGKVTRLHQWLASRGQKLEDFDQCWFYSDSINDLPLLEVVSNPVAVNPDQKLLTIAQARQWPVMQLFETHNDS
ncbi:MAG: HAD family hydrolase [Burkholderiaceae bacterium]